MHKLRQELSTLGETLSAYVVAGAKRVISFGFDESTKLQARALPLHTSPPPPPSLAPSPFGIGGCHSLSTPHPRALCSLL